MKTLLFILAFLISGSCLAQLTPRPLGANTNKGCYFGYYEYLPDHYEDSTKWPVILFLHGIGEKGNGTSDLSKLLKHGPLRLVNEGKKIPAIIIAPQNTDGWFYTEFLGGIREDGTTHPTLKPKSIIELIKKYKIDTTRIYVTGLSAGGKGAMKCLGFYPDFFTAGVVIAPADSSNRDYMIKSPVWLFHNEFDNIIPLQRSKNILYNLKKSNKTYADLSVYKNVSNHDAWTTTYNNQQVWSWLFAQKKRPPVDISFQIKEYLDQKARIDYKIDSLLNGAKVIR